MKGRQRKRTNARKAGAVKAADTSPEEQAPEKSARDAMASACRDGSLVSSADQAVSTTKERPWGKLHLTWEEWLEARKARRATCDLIHPGPIRRKSSRSDKRLRATFYGERGPRLD